jgi:hypothetical protein
MSHIPWNCNLCVMPGTHELPRSKLTGNNLIKAEQSGRYIIHCQFSHCSFLFIKVAALGHNLIIYSSVPLKAQGEIVNLYHMNRDFHSAGCRRDNHLKVRPNYSHLLCITAA